MILYTCSLSAKLFIGLLSASNSPIYNLYNIVMHQKYFLTETNMWYYKVNVVEKILIFN